MGKLADAFCCALTLAIAFPCLAKSTRVAVDAGHSTAHPGAMGAYGQPEFGFNAALATTLTEWLSAQGIAVIKIGHDGNMLDLKKRTQLANAAGADFFLSIHHDSVQPQYLKPWQWQGKNFQSTDHASGFSLFVSRQNPQLASSLRCASEMGKALKQEGFQPSQHHAEAVEGENKAWADQSNGVFYYDNLVVLKTAAMPAVLLEAAVIANRQDAEKAEKPEFRKRMAAAITNGLRACGAL